MKYLLDFHSWVDLIGLSWLDLMDLLIDYDWLMKCRLIDWCFRFPFGTNYVSGVVLITGVVPALLTHLSSLALLARLGRLLVIWWPLRSNDQPWGIAGLSLRELDQLHMGSHLMLNSLGELRICLAAGAIMEHPAIPDPPDYASVWRWLCDIITVNCTWRTMALRRRIGEACHFAWSWPSWTCPPSSDNDQDWIEKKTCPHKKSLNGPW